MGKLGGTASIEVDASLEMCWALAQDVAIAPEWQGGLDAIEVVERDASGRVVLADSITDAKVRTVRTRVRFTYEEPHRVAWTQEKGDLKTLIGAWVLEDLGAGRTKVTYLLEGDPGRVLGMLVRGPVEDRLRDLLVTARPEEFARALQTRS